MAKSILLCDDEIHILRAAEFKFRRAGFDVRAATDGQEALELVQQDRPDLIITDYQMPRMDGLELTRNLRQQFDATELPIVLLTAKGFELNHEDITSKLGILQVYSKPFSPRELLKFVEGALEESTVTA